MMVTVQRELGRHEVGADVAPARSAGAAFVGLGYDGLGSRWPLPGRAWRARRLAERGTP